MQNVVSDMLNRATDGAKIAGFMIVLLITAGTSWAQPANDDFDGAEPISGISGSVAGDNTGATIEPGEPSDYPPNGGPYATVWYTWTAPADGAFVFDTIGSIDPFDSSAMDTMLGVFTGNSVDALTSIAGNDDYDPNIYGPSRVSFTAVAGTVYQISVDGYGGSEGNIVLNWRQGGGQSAGNLQFTARDYIVTENESFRPWLNSTIAPSVEARTTVTRLLGSTGRISVDYTVTNILYTNYFYTNVYGTNITIATFASNNPPVFTNLAFTNFFVTNQFENNVNGSYTYCNEYFYTSVSGTNSGTNGLVTATNVVFLATNGIFVTSILDPVTYLTTNTPCLNFTNGPVTNIDAATFTTNISITNVFCYLLATNEVVNSAEPDVDYRPETGTIYLDDYQMSADIFVRLFQNNPFPDIVNRTVTVILSNPALDPLESPDISPPGLNPGQSTAYIDVLDLDVAEGARFNTCDETNMIVNFESSTFRVRESESAGFARVYVLRSGGNGSQSCSVDYRIDNRSQTSGSDLDLNTFTLQAGSDYASPAAPGSRYSANQDFTPVTGTLTWGANDFSPRTIDVPIINDNLPEFNEDLLLQLYNPQPVPATGPRTLIGYVRTATLTILFNDQPAGAMNRGWNVDGSLSTDPVNNQRPGANKTVFATAVQPADGKTVIGGTFTAYNTKPRNRLARINTDGSFDASFDPGSGANDFVTCLAIDESGKIIVGGGFTSINGINRFSIARLNTDGSLDPSFDPGLGVNGTVWAVALQSDGKIVIGGDFNFVNGTNRNFVARLNSDGSLDPTFNADVDSTVRALGIPAVSVCVPPNPAVITFNPLAIDFRAYSNYTENCVNITAPGNSHFHTVANPANGSTAAEIFSVDGTPQTITLPNNAPFSLASINFLAVNATVTITSSSGGSVTIPGPGVFTFDASFSNITSAVINTANGDVTIDDITLVPLTMAPGASLVIGGDFSMVGGQSRLGVARLNSDGSVDNTFNPGVGADDTVYSVAVQTDGKPIIGGGFKTINLISRRSIARLNTDGSVDASFDPGIGADDTVYSVLAQTDGKVMVGGMFTSINETRRVGIARLLANGSVDTSFMDTAYNQFAGLINHYFDETVINTNLFPAFNMRNYVLSVGLQNNGNVIIGGSFSQVGGGGTRVDIHPRLNVAQLIGGQTTGPGNIEFDRTAYNADENGLTSYVTLVRTNGSLGVAAVTVEPVTLPSGPGAAVLGSDFTFDAATYGNPVWLSSWANSRMLSDGTFGLNTISDSIDPNTVYTYPNNDVVINTLDNYIIDGNRDLNIKLSHPNGTDIFTLGGENIPLGVALGKTLAKMTIVDNDVRPGILSFASSSFSTNEGATNAIITVVRTQGSEGQVTVKYRVNPLNPGTAVYGSDYTTNKFNTLTFQPGVTTTNFTIPLINDGTNEPDKTINLILYNPTGGATNGMTNTTLTIIDDDFGPGHLHFTATNYDAVEGIGYATVTVARLGGSQGLLSVKCGTSNGTATNGVDYTGVTNSLSWNSGDTAPRTVTIPIIDDELVENAETINLKLFNPIVGVDTNNLNLQNGKVLNDPSNATVTIINDDNYGVPNFIVTNYFVMENAGSAVITVVRVGGVAGAVSVGYATLNGTATNCYQGGPTPCFYTGTTNRLDFAAGETAKSFSVLIADNITTNSFINGSPNRVVNLVLFNPTPAAIDVGFPKFATLTIIDDESNNEPAGSIDPVYSPNATFDNFVHALALQPDGKLLAGGDFTLANKVPRNRVARLNVDGSLDTGFLFNLTGVDGPVLSVLSQTPDGTNTNGRILIGGTFSQVNGVNRGHIARLNLDGSLDGSFDPGSGANNPVHAVAETFLGSNRKILIVGNFTTVDGAPRNGIARLNDDGKVDQSFNLGSGINGTNGTVFAVAVQANGKILIGGDFTSFNGVPRGHLARLNISGTLDMSFNADTGTNGSVRAIKLQPDGKILIGGLFTNVNGLVLNHVARLNADGSVDPAFNVGVGVNDAVFAIALDASGKILLGGEFTQGSGVTRNRLTRLKADGTVDPTINFGFGANSFVASIVEQPWDGRIIIGGGFTEYDGVPKLHIARLYGGATTGAGTLEFTSPYFGVAENGTNAVIQVRRRGGTQSPNLETKVAYVNFTTSDGTALAGVDYAGVTNTLAFPDGETFQSILVPVIDNFIVDGDRTVNLALSLPAFPDIALGGQPFATLIITNDDSTISFQRSTYSVGENVAGSNALITVVRTGSLFGSSTVDYVTTTNGTATAAVDYSPVTNTLLFAPGETNKTFSVAIANDSLIEGDETVGLQLSNPTGAILTTPNTATLTIVDDDNGPGILAFSAPAYFVNEGSNTTVTIIRSNGSFGTVSIGLTTVDVTATSGVDYRPTNTIVSFGPGEVTKDILLSTLQDALVEGNETLNLVLSNPQGGALIGVTNLVPLTIIDDDVSFSFSSPAYFVNEGDGSATITVRRDNGTNGTVQVSYATTNAAPTNGIAVAGVDYVTTTGTLTFTPGETEKTFNIPMLEDTLVEGNESFSVLLSNPIGAQLGNPSVATVNILDNDTAFGFSSTNYFIDEGGTNVTIIVNRLNPNTGIATIGFATSNGTATATADYLSTNGILTFLDGESSKTFTIPILDDSVIEGSETVLLTLFSPSPTNAAILTNSATLTIIDNDAGIRFSAATYSISESGVQATINVLRTTVTNTQVSVDFVTSNSTATAGLDYQPTNGTLIFAPGETVKSFSVRIIDDTVIEGDEDVFLSLSTPTGGAVLANPSVATLTLMDNDGSVIVPAGSMLVSESGAGAADGVIDPNETVALLFAFRSTGGGNTANLVATLLPTNGITSPSGSQSYGVLVERGPSVSRQFSFTASGTNGQHITATFQLQDGVTNLGIGTFSYILGKTSVSFSNTAPIVINDSTNPPTKATPYPSTITISSFAGTVSKVTARLSYLYHTFPDDIDAMLVSPLGQNSLLMSDCGGRNGVNGVQLTFDDDAASNLGDTNQITSGSYKPTNFTDGPVTTDPFPGPAPAGPYATSLSVFKGINPNGIWSLYIVDDSSLDSGSITNGWSLTFLTSTPVAPSADLAMTMTDSPHPAVLSNLLTYTITITNYGPSTATGVTSSYTLPPGTIYVTNYNLISGVTPNPTTVTSNANGVVVTIQHGTFPKDTGVAFALVVIPTSVGSITNIAVIGANESDPNLANNTATVVSTVNIASADLATTIAGSPNPVITGNNVTYTIVVTNNGPVTATGVFVTNTLPAGMIFVSASASPVGTCSHVNGTVICDLGNLAASSSIDTITIVAQTIAPGEWTDTAHVGSTVFDPLKANNTASVKTVVEGPQITVSRTGNSMILSWPLLANHYLLEKTASLSPPIWVGVTNPAPAFVGGVFTFPVSMTNNATYFRLRAPVP